MEPLNRSYERKRISTMCIGLLILIIATLLADLVFNLLTGFLLPELAGNLSAALWLNAAAQFAVGFPLAMMVISIVPKDPMEKTKWSFSQLGGAFLAASTMMFFGNLLGYEVNRLLAGLLGHTPSQALAEMTARTPLAGNILLLLILSPVFEELVFRKMLIDRLNRLGDRAAILLSALLFALFHGNFYQFFYAFSVGLLFGYIYVRTGRIRYVIVLHMLLNLVFGLLPSLEAVNSLPFAEILIPAVELILAILGIVALFRGGKHFRLLRGWVDLPHFRWASLAFLNPGMLALLLVCIAMFGFNLFYL